MPDFIIILAMCFPMLLFTVYPGIKLSEFIDNRYNISETQKRYIMISTTLIVTVSLSTILFYA